MDRTMNAAICETLEEGIAATKNALYLVDTEVQKSGQKTRVVDKMLVNKAIQKCEAVSCLLRVGLRFPATAHLRTLTNVCATIRKLRDGDPTANYKLFLEGATVESMRVLKASEETGYRVTSIDTDEGWSKLLQDMEKEYEHRFKGVDSWTGDSQWEKSVLVADDWLAFVYQLMQWYNKCQHASPLGLMVENIASLPLFVITADGNDKDFVLDRLIRLADWLTHPTTIAWLAYGLLYQIMRTATNNQGGMVRQHMEDVEDRLNRIWDATQVRTIDDVIIIPCPPASG